MNNCIYNFWLQFITNVNLESNVLSNYLHFFIYQLVNILFYPLNGKKWCLSQITQNFWVNSECFLKNSDFWVKLRFSESLEALVLIITFIFIIYHRLYFVKCVFLFFWTNFSWSNYILNECWSLLFPGLVGKYDFVLRLKLPRHARIGTCQCCEVKCDRAPIIDLHSCTLVVNNLFLKNHVKQNRNEFLFASN